MSVWCQMFTRVPTKGNFYNTCPRDIKLNQSGQDMSHPFVIQFVGNPGSKKSITFNLICLVLLSLGGYWKYHIRYKGQDCFSSLLSMQLPDRCQLTAVALYDCHEAITVDFSQTRVLIDQAAA